MSNIEKGKYGEQLACKYLIDKGYRIIETNYKYSRYGEIDIIAMDLDELCFVEVKTRSNNHFGGPLEAITKEKLSKIYISAQNYAIKTNLKFKRCRIDVIAVELTEGNSKIQHIKNISL